MEDGTLLCDTFLCRLCGEENKNGSNLYELEENKQELSQLVNKYLPLKVRIFNYLTSYSTQLDFSSGITLFKFLSCLGNLNLTPAN